MSLTNIIRIWSGHSLSSGIRYTPTSIAHTSTTTPTLSCTTWHSHRYQSSLWVFLIKTSMIKFPWPTRNCISEVSNAKNGLQRNSGLIWPMVYINLCSFSGLDIFSFRQQTPNHILVKVLLTSNVWVSTLQQLPSS